MSRRSLSFPAAGSVIPFSDVGISRGSLVYPTVLSSLIPFRAAEQSALVELDSTTLGASASEITFSGIDQSYTDLMVSLFGRSSYASTVDFIYLRFNSDSAANYDFQDVRGWAANTGATETLAATQIKSGNLTGDGAAASIASGSRFVVFDYTRTAWQKAIAALNAEKRGTSSGNLFAASRAGFWRNTAAITSITLTLDSGSNFLTNTIATLYGWR